MDWILKGALTACSVAVVLVLARRWGRGAAGFIAGLPITTAPALAWVARDHGIACAVDAARVTVTVCAVLAAFGWVYAHAASRVRPRVALGWATGAAIALAGPALAVTTELTAAVGLAVGCCTLSLMAWPVRAHELRPESPRGASTFVASMASGAIGIGVALAVPVLGAAWAGLLSSLPVVSASVAVAEQASGGPPAVTQFLRGCVAGLLGRIAFGAVFAATASELGLAGALGLASLGACAINLAAARRLGRRSQAGRVVICANHRPKAARPPGERRVGHVAP